jgi:CP family cyanate transporter-like MFS transporter
MALFFITIMLRPPVASIGPLLNEIIADLELTPLMSGLLASAPVLCFGIGAFASPRLVRHFGVDRGMFVVLLFVLAAVTLRLTLGYAGLLVGTVAAGLAIAIANVLLPTIVRERYPKNVALVTGMYTTVLAVSASFAASIAVPSSLALGGWRQALVIWILPVVLSVALWAPIAKATVKPVPSLNQDSSSDAKAVNRSPLAWAIVGFFGIQSLGFYAILAWLPSMLIDVGVSPADAGATLGLATAVGIPTGFVLSSVLRKFKTLAWWCSGASLVTLSGFVVLMVSLALAEGEQRITASTLIFACVLIGLGQATTFPLSLTLIGTRAVSQAQTTQLSAMSQGWGYLLAAAGTFVVGYLSEISATWSWSLGLLVVLTGLQIGFGFYAGRPGHIKN